LAVPGGTFLCIDNFLGEFLVDDLEDVEWNKNTFQKLVLLGGEKDMALAVCKHKTKLSLDIDFVTGKGKCPVTPSERT